MILQLKYYYASLRKSASYVTICYKTVKKKALIKFDSLDESNGVLVEELAIGGVSLFAS